MSNKITITRALTELKTLDGRINTEVAQLSVLDVSQKKFGDKALRTNTTIQDFNDQAKSRMQKIEDLMKRKDNLKKAILKSNAEKTVEIGGQSMTVAEAIEKKRSIYLKQNLLGTLKKQFVAKNNEVQRNRQQLEHQLENMLSQNLGKDKKTNSGDYDNIAKPFIEANELRLVDPLNVKNQIDSLEEEISTFNADVDIVLSESNSQTTIEVE